MNTKKFQYICKLSQKELKKYVVRELRTTHDDITVANGFVFAQGAFPILLVAHLDTVHARTPRKIYFDARDSSLSSPDGIGGDDRCGVYMILEIIKKYNCSVVFCEDEEIGGIGAEKFTKYDFGKALDFNYIVELDRKGKNDAVFYDCDNPEFTDFVCKEFFKEAYGTFSDISIIAPALKISAVNISCGYYNAHTKAEYVVIPEVDALLDAVCGMLERTTDADKFEYIQYVSKYKYSKYDSYSVYDEWDRYYGYGEKEYVFRYADAYGRIDWESVCAYNEDEAVGKFLAIYDEIPYSAIVEIIENDWEDMK